MVRLFIACTFYAFAMACLFIGLAWKRDIEWTLGFIAASVVWTVAGLTVAMCEYHERDE